MKTVQEYLRHAHECEQLARKVTDPDQRRAISQMAETWRVLAAQRQKQRDREPSPDHESD